MAFTLRRDLWHLLKRLQDGEHTLDDAVEAIIARFRREVMPPPPDQTGTPLGQPSVVFGREG